MRHWTVVGVLMLASGCSDCGQKSSEQLPPVVSTPPVVGEENPPEDREPVLGEARWGMSKDSVRFHLAGAQDTPQGELLIRDFEYHGASTRVILEFNHKDELFQITVSVLYDDIASGEHETLYEQLRAGLVTQFGEPLKETTFDQTNGPVQDLATWRSAFIKNEDTRVDLVCRGENCEKAMSVLLRSREYRKKFE